jgi:hypothetical protein
MFRTLELSYHVNAMSPGIVFVLSCTLIPYGMTVIVKDISFFLGYTQIFNLQYLSSATQILSLLLLFIPMVLPTKLRSIVMKTPCLGDQTGRHPSCCVVYLQK